MKTLNRSKRWCRLGLAVLIDVSWLGLAQEAQPPPVYTGNPPPAQTPAAVPAATPAPPPSAPAKLSGADLEKLVAPIALYPDPLLATVLPASVYPLEIVQAARFVADTNNLAKLDEQPWDASVKAVARIPEAIKKLNDDLPWTIQLGEAFLAQDKDVMDAIQSMRGKGQKAGTLQTSPQQVVTVTNMVVEKTVEEKVVVVTNTVVQIQPANPQVVYVPSYPPTVYYPPPGYVYDPVAPLVTFGVGMAMGAIIANNCNWHGGGVYVGHHGIAVWGGGGYHGDVNVDIDRNVNNSFNRNTSVNPNRGSGATAAQQKWQPDQSRLNKSGASASTANREARGWGSGGAGTSASAGNLGARPSTGSIGPRPSTGTVGTRPSTGAVPPSARPSAGTTGLGGRSSSNSLGPAARSSPSAGRGSSDSAFGGIGSGASTRDFSSRGAGSRSSGGLSAGGGLGGRGGGFSGGRAGGGRRR